MKVFLRTCNTVCSSVILHYFLAVLPLTLCLCIYRVYKQAGEKNQLSHRGNWRWRCRWRCLIAQLQVACFVPNYARQITRGCSKGHLLTVPLSPLSPLPLPLSSQPCAVHSKKVFAMQQEEHCTSNWSRGKEHVTLIVALALSSHPPSSPTHSSFPSLHTPSGAA